MAVKLPYFKKRGGAFFLYNKNNNNKLLEVNILNTENNEMILYAVAMLMENE